MNNKQNILLILGLFLAQFSFADIIDPNTHYVEKCVKITNIEDYSELCLLGYISMGDYHENTYEISGTECLYKGYKYNTLAIYATTKSKIQNEDIQKLDLPNATYAFKADLDINPYAGYYADADPTIGIDEFYKIMGFKDNRVVLHLYKKVTKYNNGDADKVETFSYAGNLSELEQQFTVGLNNDSSNGLKVFPNPTHNYIYVTTNGNYNGQLFIDVYSVKGERIESKFAKKSLGDNYFTMPVSHLPKGVYIFNVRFGDVSESRKIMIE